MNLLGIGTGELVLIVVIILLVIGPERLPQLVRQWAKVVKTLSQFTRTWQQFNAELNRQLTLEEMAGDRPRPTPAAGRPRPSPAPEPEPADHTIAPPELAELAAAGEPAAAEPEDSPQPSTAVEDPRHE